MLAGHQALRSAVVPRRDETVPEPKQLSLFVPRELLELPAITMLGHLHQPLLSDNFCCSGRAFYFVSLSRAPSH